MTPINIHVITEEEVLEKYGVTQESPLAERVAAGARWLDEHVDEWATRVSLPEFDIQSRCDCVLGQVFKTVDLPSAQRQHDLGFDRVVEGWDDPVDPEAAGGDILSAEASRALGFDAPTGSNIDEYDFLQDEWGTLIDARQSA